MESPAHGAMVAGVTSCVSAAWVRKQVVNEYDPAIEPPPLEERIATRAPIFAAGLGFTALSATVSMSFDLIESRLLADKFDSRSPNQQIENHRELHTLPYLGSAVGVAHLIRKSGSHFGEWVASKLHISEKGERVITALNDLADWVIDSVGVGVVGHLFGDVPTKGHGGTALRLLKPLSDHNFALQWVSHASKPLNKYLVIGGSGLSAAAWTFAAGYALSWEPPEKRLYSYLESLDEEETYRDALGQVSDDLSDSITKILPLDSQSLWETSMFHDPLKVESGKLHSSPISADIDCQSVFGLSDFSQITSSDSDILPEGVRPHLDGEQISPNHQEWQHLDGLPISDSESTIEESLSTSESPLYSAQVVQSDSGEDLSANGKDGEPL